MAIQAGTLRHRFRLEVETSVLNVTGQLVQKVVVIMRIWGALIPIEARPWETIALVESRPSHVLITRFIANLPEKFTIVMEGSERTFLPTPRRINVEERSRELRISVIEQ